LCYYLITGKEKRHSFLVLRIKCMSRWCFVIVIIYIVDSEEILQDFLLNYWYCILFNDHSIALEVKRNLPQELFSLNRKKELSIHSIVQLFFKRSEHQQLKDNSYSSNIYIDKGIIYLCKTVCYMLVRTSHLCICIWILKHSRWRCWYCYSYIKIYV
jgi:hypothetical protein